MPNELVKKVNKKTLSTAEKTVINSQWNSIKEYTLRQIENRKAELLESGSGVVSNDLNIGKLLVMSDVSGSMTGDPMDVSIGLGILISEICNPAFRDLVLTFSGNPNFHSLKYFHGFVDKVQSMNDANWGWNTDFEKAMNLVAGVIEKNNLNQEDIPDILCISDMQFDAAIGPTGYGSNSTSTPWSTTFDNITKLFSDLGTKMYGKPFKAPNIIFWNVRATPGFPASSTDKGVVLMSGYSPSLLKFVLSGEMSTEESEEGKSEKITPRDMLQKILSESKLDVIRQELDNLF
jgi:hypothetical protein